MTVTVTRAEPVGSLLRPEELLRARARLDAGELTPERFKRVEDAMVDRAVALQ
jgi:5-methyltetrahydropteroyltriglutamate--homocysteine methyltransferase